MGNPANEMASAFSIFFFQFSQAKFGRLEMHSLESAAYNLKDKSLFYGLNRLGQPRETWMATRNAVAA